MHAQPRARLCGLANASLRLRFVAGLLLAEHKKNLNKKLVASSGKLDY
jgi:hypothetical protein